MNINPAIFSLFYHSSRDGVIYVHCMICREHAAVADRTEPSVALTWMHIYAHCKQDHPEFLEAFC